MKNTRHARHARNLATIIAVTAIISAPAHAEGLKVSATAYCNPNNNPTCSGEPTIEGVTAAGKRDWLGRKAAIYEVSENVLIYYGTRTFTDTGYGRDSEKHPGKGTIQTGEDIDIFFESKQDAKEWGRKTVYIEFLED